MSNNDLNAKTAALSQENGVQSIFLESQEIAQHLFGYSEENLRIIERLLGVKLTCRGNQLFIRGEKELAELVSKLIQELIGLVKTGYPLFPSDIEQATKLAAAGEVDKIKQIFGDTVMVTAKKRMITPRSLNQKTYIDAIRNFDIVFAIGPAGTGKTYLAMAMAVHYLNTGEVDRIILTRPAVEAGEKLGFLPGDLVEKVNPYLRPLYDALHDMMSFEKAQRLIEKGAIEVAPLAFMRGRTLNDSMIILDEAQNTSSEQMKMFLTRLGFNSKAVITGDITQIDLPQEKISGLVEIQHILKNVQGIFFSYFTKEDVVRHRLVNQIIQAYEDYENQKQQVKDEAQNRNHRRTAMPEKVDHS